MRNTLFLDLRSQIICFLGYPFYSHYLLGEWVHFYSREESGSSPMEIPPIFCGANISTCNYTLFLFNITNTLSHLFNRGLDHT